MNWDWKKRWPAYVATLLVVFIVGAIATLAVLYFLSATPSGEALRTRLGLNNFKTFTISTNKNQTINVQESSQVIDTAKNVSPSVVSITATGQAQTNLFSINGLSSQPSKVAGSGFIVTSDGLIATNKHVVTGNAGFKVTTSDGKTYDATVAATDPVIDFALLKITAHGLPVVDFGNSDDVQVGQWVVAIGNALGQYQNTVTVGVISGLNRQASPADEATGATESLDNLIQTDAAINPGNSGGPLLTLGGQVIGINTAIAASAQSLGFVTPSNEIQKSLASYTKNGKILRAFIGVQYEPLTATLASTLGLTVTDGALIKAVTGAPAQAAGLQVNDVITKVNSDAVTQSNPLSKIIRSHDPGEQITLTILRNKTSQTVKLTLGTLGN
ncbi:MAG TPA: trypsin-like peptidase domain-containing protein [Candidatus Saccharimonadales bacterium]|nr:trypsin-like peptidase domain-containing protein [Candidatus Saccharimonadales bacterium]